MNWHRRIGLNLGLAYALGAVIAGRCDAAIITVGGSGAAASTIAAGIAMSHPGDTIVVGAGTFNEHDLVIPHQLSITAAGAAGSVIVNLTGGAGFQATGISNLFFIGLSLRNGYATSAGGAINCANCANVIIQNCSFLDNQAVDYGGAVALHDSPFAIYGCSFTDNAVGGYGGGALSITGASSNGTISGCSFTGNTADSAGALSLAEGEATVTECWFESNSSNQSGGAIAAFNVSSLTVSNSTFLNCSAGNGGGIMQPSALGTFNLDVSSCLFSGCQASFGGGAIFSGESPVITGSTFLNCQSDALGGAIYTDSGSIENCTFHGSHAASAGAALFVYSSASIERNIISTSTGQPAVDQPFATGIACNVFHDNAAGNAQTATDPVGSNGNVELDPRFCDVHASDFHLAVDSPAAADNVPPACGATDIGAWPVACGETVVRTTSWGRLKSRYGNGR